MAGCGDYIGRAQQGQELPLTLQCTDADGVPSVPSANPGVAIYRDAASPVLLETRELAADDRGVVTGLFRLPLFLGALYSLPGRYLAVFRYSVAGVARVKPVSFVVNAGGSPDGSVVAMYYVFRPNARYLIRQTDSGQLVRGKNPR